MKEFVDIYNGYNQQVRSILFRFTSQDESIDDMVQETFIKIWKSLDAFENRSSLKTWIYRVTINSAIDYQRKNKKHQNHEDINDVQGPQAREKTDQIINQQLVDLALSKISIEHKSVVVLSLYQQLTNEEVSQVLDIPVGTVKSRLFNAKKEMISTLKSKGIDLLDLEGE